MNFIEESGSEIKKLIGITSRLLCILGSRERKFSTEFLKCNIESCSPSDLTCNIESCGTRWTYEVP